MCATPRGCGRGSAPYRRTPHEETRPNIYSDRNANAGKQRPARSGTRHGWKTPRERQQTAAPLSPLHSVTSVPLRSPVSSDCWRSSDVRHATRVRKGERPLPPYPPRKTRPNILLAGTPTRGSKAAIRDTPRLKQGTPPHPRTACGQERPPLRHGTSTRADTPRATPRQLQAFAHDSTGTARHDGPHGRRGCQSRTRLRPASRRCQETPERSYGPQ